jgi:hypothetical protein
MIPQPHLSTMGRSVVLKINLVGSHKLCHLSVYLLAELMRCIPHQNGAIVVSTTAVPVRQLIGRDNFY